MTSNAQLLKQIRKIASVIRCTTGNDQHKAMLASVDLALQELQLRQSPDFYLQYLVHGRLLAATGIAIAQQNAAVPAPPSVFRKDLGTSMQIESFFEEIEELHRHLATLVMSLDEGCSVVERDFLIGLSDWEATLYQHSLRGRPEPATTVTDLTLARWEIYLRQRFPQLTSLRVTKFLPLEGGFSKATILSETHDELHGARSMVLRADQPVKLLHFAGSDVRKEYYMIKLMQQAGVPVAAPLWLEPDAGRLGVPFLVSTKAQGRTYGGNLGGTEALAQPLIDSIVETLIQLHSVRVDRANPLVQESHLREWLPYESVSEATRYCVCQFMPRLAQLSGVSITPQLARALKWLENNIPDVDEPAVIVHLDYALNNLIIADNRVIAVLDWETSHLGDPAKDISWTQSNLNASLPMTEFLKKYCDGTGRAISEYRLAYARVQACALNAISCLSAANALASHDDANVNMCVLAYKYMGIFGSQFNELIAAAELLKPVTN